MLVATNGILAVLDMLRLRPYEGLLLGHARCHSGGRTNRSGDNQLSF
jgi:hypothetical protein